MAQPSNNNNGGISKLESDGNLFRNNNIVNNVYNNADTSNNYTSSHTRALADSKTPNYGKGTGLFLDIENYKAGSDLDINGNQGNSVGSGRVPAFALNASTWGYGPAGAGMTPYKAPDTSKNKGQVTI